jgi:hypothetical protein
VIDWLSPWRWWPLRSERATYETEQPWVIYKYRTTDQRTRITGRSIVDCECAICGSRERLRIRIPRIGPVPVPRGGKHVERLRFLRDHVHPDRPAQMAWARPLLNPFASGPLDLDALAMRLEADLREAGSPWK